MEEWRSAVGFPDYEVSSLGQVRSPRRRRGSRGGEIKGINKCSASGAIAAVRVNLRKDGVTYQRAIHVMVLEAFVGPRPIGMDSCHGDDNPLNNELGNLRWDTHRSNWEDSVKHGTAYTPTPHTAGENPSAVLTEDDVRQIRSTPLRLGTKIFLARKFGVHRTTINRVLSRDTWRHV